MLRTIHRPLGYLVFGLAACAIIPWTGAVTAQPPGTKARGNFLPYQPPGTWRPTQAAQQIGLFGTNFSQNLFGYLGGQQGQGGGQGGIGGGGLGGGGLGG
ncbi:MAG: hypothetical protein K2X87_26020, partial [Gemmataceae bacterium]|nr:hypothetical protein [Gemmataceae bacterium]